MAGIRGKDTKPEILIRKILFRHGFRFRLHRRDLPGNPDIVLPKYAVAIFVHGCFWHRHVGCHYFRLPASNAEFWDRKLASNVARDHASKQALRATGWRVLTVWECATRGRADDEALARKIVAWVKGSGKTGLIQSKPVRQAKSLRSHGPS